MTFFDKNRYGLEYSSPVCLGGSGKSRRETVADYLGKLRCPKGTGVDVVHTSFSLDSAVAGEVMAELQARGKAKGNFYEQWDALCELSAVTCGVYEIKCKCGEHHTKVFLATYVRTENQRPISLPGWTLAGE